MARFQFQKGNIPWNIGKKHSEETKKKISESHKRLGTKPPSNKGKHHSEKAKKKMREVAKRRKGRKQTEEIKRKISETMKRKQIGKGKKHTEKEKEKMRKARFEYIKKMGGITFPTIGRNEKRLLDELEKKLGNRIIRQYEVGGYCLDGYVPEINLAIEVDEEYHKDNKEKDIQREEFIKAKLGCRFLRIKDY